MLATMKSLPESPRHLGLLWFLVLLFVGIFSTTSAHSSSPDGDPKPAAVGVEPKRASDGAPLERASIPDLIKALGANGFRSRRAASRELAKRGREDHVSVLKFCTEGYFGSDDPEVKHRCKVLMKSLVLEHLFTRPKGFLGITMVLGSDRLNGKKVVYGVEVTMVVANSAAKEAGLRVGDLIYVVDDLSFTEESSVQTFIGYVGAKKAGTIVQLKVSRNGKAINLKATLKPRPEQYNDIKESDQEFFQRWFDTQLELHRNSKRKKQSSSRPAPKDSQKEK